MPLEAKLHGAEVAVAYEYFFIFSVDIIVFKNPLAYNNKTKLPRHEKVHHVSAIKMLRSERSAHAY